MNIKKLLNLSFLSSLLIFSNISAATTLASNDLTKNSALNFVNSNTQTAVPVTNPNSKDANVSPLPENAKKVIKEAQLKKTKQVINKNASDKDILNAVSEQPKKNSKTKSTRSKEKVKRTESAEPATTDSKNSTTATSASNNDNHEHTANYRIIEIKEGEFQPKDENGKVSNQKYSAYWLSLESEDGDDEDSIKRANHYYFMLKAGAVMSTNYGGNSPVSGSSGDSTYTVGFAIGKKFMDRFAAELEFMHKSSSDVSGTVLTKTDGNQNTTWGSKSDTFMFNLSADIIKHRIFRPYVKAGIGTSINYAENLVISTSAYNTTKTYAGQSKTNFAWQIGTGLNIFINKNVDANIEYMYVNRGDIETSGTFYQGNQTLSGTSYYGKIKDNVFTLGVKIKF